MHRIGRYQVILFMLLCLLIGAVLRLPGLPAVPPGLHYDEAANGILAADIGLRGERPLFITSYTGKEPLFFYLAGGLMALIGKSVFTLRLTAAFVGLLTIAATYWLGREWLLNRRIVLIAVALLTVSFWHLLFSRLGFRAITQPLLQTLTIAALFRGIRRHKPGWLLIGGLFLGLTAYTYLAARLFPLLLLLCLGPLLIQGRQRWGTLALYGGMALLVLLPLAIYFITHPDLFWVRINQVSAASDNATLVDNYLNALGMFFLRGDPYWRFNLPQRPLFDWFWGGLLLVGWAICIVRLRQVAYDWQRSTLLLLILAPFVMILPTALAVNEITPSNLRAIGLIPFIFYLPAVGLMTLLQDLETRFPRLPVTAITLAVGMAVLLGGGIMTYQHYFRQWATMPDLYYESDGDLTAVAAFLDQVDLTDTTLFVAAAHYQHPTLAFLSPHYERIKWLPQSQALVFPAEGPALYIYPHNSPLPTWATPYLSTPLVTDTVAGPDGDPAFTAYTLPAPLSPLAPTPAQANFGNAITLLGYRVDSAAVGTTLPLTLFWHIVTPPLAAFTPFVHLEDAWQQRWSQVETFAYPAAQWQTGELVIQQVDLPVPAGTPPGTYQLRLGLFNPATEERLPQLDANGRYAGDTFTINPVPITAAAQLPTPLPTPPFVIDAPVRDGLHLLGYGRGRSHVMTGEPLDLTLWWKATTPQPQLTTRLELMRADNTGHILVNTQPVHDTYPFHGWLTPQFLIDPLSPRIPESFPPGDYRLFVRILDALDETLLTADLGPLTIEATERQFTPPPIPIPFAATFGDEIQLLGYDLTPLTEGEAHLTLYWQAERQPTADYTVFVHILGLDGTCCVWQQDVMPRQNQYPTSRWLAGEVVIDTYLIRPDTLLPPGRYPTEIGLYIAQTGRRLQAVVPAQETRDAVYLRPLEVP